MSHGQSISTRRLNTIFSHLTENDHKVLWVNSADLNTQLYISPSFKTVWKRSCGMLYDCVHNWKTTLAEEEIDNFAKDLQSRRLTETEKDSQNNSVLYRIYDGQGKLIWIKDSYFYLLNSDNEVVAVAGIAEAISETQWTLEIEKNCSFENDQIQIFKKGICTHLEKELKLTVSASRHGILSKNQDHSVYQLMLNGEQIRLSSREVECLNFLSKGYSDKQIGQSLGISPRTVESYVNRIKEKINCRRRIELVSHIKALPMY